jgi:FAD/FMN-containing dehydrogenase
MARLNQVKYNEKEETVEVGAGCLFCEVYNHILPLGRNIVGGVSIPGVGVGGWLQGGGYSLKTNQYGLGIDNIKEIQIVLPKGGKDAIQTVSDKSRDELGDLFWAIKVSLVVSPVTCLVPFAILRTRAEETILGSSPNLRSRRTGRILSTSVNAGVKRIKC